jgi:Rps23 Pro-64 3,4-dihydroxylase Tpa1-like proline 4-hydroxylase
MNVKIYKEPVYHIVIDDFLPQELNSEIFEHLVSLQQEYIPAGIGADQQVNQSYRSNLSLNMDRLYHLADNQDPQESIAHRASSPLLRWLDALLYDEQWLSFLDAAAFPLNEMRYCDYWSTQVSRYGSKDQYKWHYDAIPGDSTRILTVIYYLHHAQKEFTHGELCLSDGLLWGEELVGENTRATIEPKNNRLVIFESKTMHAVMPTQAPETFDKGRFSVNIWIGKYPE